MHYLTPNRVILGLIPLMSITKSLAKSPNGNDTPLKRVWGERALEVMLKVDQWSLISAASPKLLPRVTLGFLCLVRISLGEFYVKELSLAY